MLSALMGKVHDPPAPLGPHALSSNAKVVGTVTNARGYGPRSTSLIGQLDTVVSRAFQINTLFAPLQSSVNPPAPKFTLQGVFAPM